MVTFFLLGRVNLETRGVNSALGLVGAGGGSDPFMKSRKEDMVMQSRRDSILMWL